ncbi:amidase signature domain-containing protein [Xylariaceae sp. FL0016]|nr:amidase signature domain-containing protein [Xylariaceae sp. FL0016]
MSQCKQQSPLASPPTITVAVGGSPYLLDQVRAVVDVVGNEDRYIPATFLGGSREISKFEDDDVWIDSFLEALIVEKNCESVPNVGQGSEYRLICDTSLPPGPYIIQTCTGCVYSIYRLYEDLNDCFVGGALPNGQTKYSWLAASHHIPVPPKLYQGSPDDDRPLAGLRFGVKDAIDIAGLETGNGSKCYRQFFPPRDSTAECIKELIAAGAVMVGKLRCCQWCDGQDPVERLEEVTPTNPRGDGFQKPSASSSGSAASCASYPWLDFTVGTDTGGSIRHPAGVNGLYGIRPSIGSMKSSGLVCTALMDTPGVFARSAAVTELAANVMMGKATASGRPRQKPKFRIIYAVEKPSTPPSETPKYFSRSGRGPEATTPAGKVMEHFVRGLEKFLGSPRKEVSIFDLWKESHPVNMPDDLLEATGSIYKSIVYGQLFRDVVHPFVKQYKQHHGQPPFIEARTIARLNYGASLSDEQVKLQIGLFHAFADWVNTILLPAPLQYSDQIPLLIYPQSWGRPQYRDELGMLDPKQIFWDGFSVYSISYCSGCPDITVPLGETTYTSKFSEREEYIPVAISIASPRGTDSELLGLLSELEAGKVLRPVTCGSRLFAHN